MSYATQYTCDENVTPRECDPCGDDFELGGVRHGALVREDFEFSDPRDPAEWQTGIAGGQILMLSKIKGSCNGGEPKVIPGYGDQKEQVIGYDYTATLKDGAYKQNYPFWNTARKSKRWKLAYFTNTLVHITDEVVTIKPKNPVEEGLDSIVEWTADVVWFQKELVSFHDATGLSTILTCENF
ncbi:MAG: hypothetical protein QM791_23785 [Ferruginibacter sp.]